MVNPIKLIMRSINPIVVYLSDLPRIFNSRFNVHFAIENCFNTQEKLGVYIKHVFGINSNSSIKQQSRIIPVSQFIFKSSLIPKLQEKINVKSNFDIQSNISGVVNNRLNTESKIGFISRFKSIVARFIIHDEVNNKALSVVNYLTVEDFLTAEII